MSKHFPCSRDPASYQRKYHFQRLRKSSWRGTLYKDICHRQHPHPRVRSGRLTLGHLPEAGTPHPNLSTPAKTQCTPSSSGRKQAAFMYEKQTALSASRHRGRPGAATATPGRPRQASGKHVPARPGRPDRPGPARPHDQGG